MVGQCSDLSTSLGTHLDVAEGSKCHAVLICRLVCGPGLADSLVVTQLATILAGGSVRLAAGLPGLLVGSPTMASVATVTTLSTEIF